MSWKVYHTETFEKQLRKLSEYEQKEISYLEDRLVINPFIGKPLHYIFIREHKIKKRRIYYLIYQDMVLVIMAGISEKKNQQETIDSILQNLALYKQLSKTLRKKV